MWPYIEANLADENVRAILPEKFVNDPERLQRAFDKLAEWEMAQKSPRCVNLGDCHQGNTYVMPDSERVWLDWQLVRKGRPWRDLTYFTIRLEEHTSELQSLLR